jgi:hypothetical protein
LSRELNAVMIINVRDKMRGSDPSVPRARMERLLIQELADELLVYDLDSNKAHCLNQTAALVWKHSDGKKSVSQIASLLENVTGSQVDDEVVLIAYHQLARCNLLQGQIPSTLKSRTLSRRDVMRRIGSAAAVSLPLVSSIVAPGAVQAATCIPSGQSCTTGAQCCSAVCNAGTCA